MAKPEFGTKRQCQSCGTKFYDLGKDPIICPKCGTVFQVVAIRSTRAMAAVADEEIEADPVVATAVLVPLEEVDVVDDEKAIVTDDIELDDEVVADDDDTFLETEEDESDDVTDLIDGDIGDDEEG